MKKIFTLTVLFLFILVLPAYAKNKQDTIQNNIEYMNISWWQRYNDENLTNNLFKIYEKNYDLKNAALIVKENEQAVKLQFADELPKLGLSGELYRTLQSSMQQFGSNMQIPSYAQYNFYLPLTMQYELDIWGTNYFKTKSAKQRLEISKQAERATYIALTSDFASDYFNLIKADEFLSIQNQLVKIQEDIVSKVSDKYNIGLCSINELLVEQKMLTTLKEERNRHIKTRDTFINSLRVYLSDSDNNIDRSAYKDITLLKNIPLKYSTDVIENRPDYLQEEANIKSIGFDVKAARREFLPNL